MANFQLIITSAMITLNFLLFNYLHVRNDTIIHVAGSVFCIKYASMVSYTGI